MKRAPEWTVEEFDILLRNISLDAETLSSRYLQRTASAIEIVRSGIHTFHQKGDSSLLSKMMKKRLTKSGTTLVCPICGERLAVRPK